MGELPEDITWISDVECVWIVLSVTLTALTTKEQSGTPSGQINPVIGWGGSGEQIKLSLATGSNEHKNKVSSKNSSMFHIKLCLLIVLTASLHGVQ